MLTWLCHSDVANTVARVYMINLIIFVLLYHSLSQSICRWAEPRPQPENGRMGDKPTCGFVQPLENQRHQSDWSIQRSKLVNMRWPLQLAAVLT